MIKKKQIDHLFEKGYVALPQLSYNGSIDDSSIDEFKNNASKTYNSDTDFHIKYLEENKIKTTFRDQLLELSEKYLNINSNPDDIYTISRIVYSYDNLESYRGHFDSHLFTLVTPVQIPRLKDKESGQLIVFPKIRKEPSNEISNFFGKLKFNLMYANKNGFRKLMNSNKFVEFDFSNLEPILFLGRQCFHGNRSFKKAPDGVRITLLTHFFDPSSVGIGGLLRKIRNR